MGIDGALRPESMAASSIKFQPYPTLPDLRSFQLNKWKCEYDLNLT